MSKNACRIAIFHYNPLELFPPVMNMVNYLAWEGKDKLELVVYTTQTPDAFQVFQCSNFNNVTIIRVGTNESKKGPLIRYATYLWHYLYTLVHCVLWKPSSMFYIETMSSPVPVFLKNTLYKGRDLFIHYHEYMGPDEYLNSTILAKAHKSERLIFDKAAWVSHTNQDRMELFLKDIKQVPAFPIHIMPNYPSVQWAKTYAKKEISIGKPIRIVYVGAVDLNTMFFPEFINWVEMQNGAYTFDILSNQDPKVILEYMESRNTKFITVQPTASYFDLPKTLCTYDVGVILYKGLSKNFLYNAPNKLFEYLACGLDVWYPSHLKGIQQYTRTDFHPQVVPLDFENLEDVSLKDNIANDERYVPANYYCEPVYKVLLENLIGEPNIAS